MLWNNGFKSDDWQIDRGRKKEANKSKILQYIYEGNFEDLAENPVECDPTQEHFFIWLDMRKG